MNKIVFFFPWKEVSGGPIYLCHLADRLAESGKYKVYYTDFYNGLSDDFLKSYRVRKLPYLQEGKSRQIAIFPDEPIILITPVYWAFDMPTLHPDSKIVFINWHNECLPVLKKRQLVGDEEYKAFLHLLEDRDCTSFCDITHWMGQKEAGADCKKQYTPIIVDKRMLRAKRQLVAENEINVAIFGRLYPDKVYADIDVVRNLAGVRTNKTINVHIIGEGPYASLLFDKYYGSNIHLIPYGTLSNDAALKTLASKTDVLFAMGTAALDGASIGLPTFIIPNEIIPFHCDEYVLLSDSVGYALGWSVEQLSSLDIHKYTMAEIIDAVYMRGKKETMGQLCLEKSLCDHSDNTSFLESCIGNSRLYFRDMEPILHSRDIMHPGDGTRRVLRRTKRALGTTKKSYSLLGMPILTVTEVDYYHYNLFFLFLPLLRADRGARYFSVRLLPLVWGGKGINKSVAYLKRVFHFAETESREVSVSGISLDAARARIKEKLAKHEKIRVCLMESRISTWQFENLYHFLETSGFFEPIVVVMPFMSQGEAEMIEEMDRTFSALSARNLRVIRGYDSHTQTFLKVREELQPDAVFYSMFWKEHFHENFYISQFEDIYSFLYPYGLDIVSHPWRQSMNFELQNKVTRYYQATIVHKAIAEDNMDNHGVNVFVTGSPKLDAFFDKSYRPRNVWKDCGEKKRIIWAPHHMILNNPEDVYQLNAFLDLAEPMRNLVQQYQERVQFAFKPHPMLKEKLYCLWGKRKTDSYFAWWENSENTQLETGEFIDLFLTSDAMILDSISFIGEYACTGKPSFFTYGEKTKFKANIFGRSLMENIYQNESPESLVDDVETFIDNVVIQGEDYKHEARTRFIDAYLRPKDGKTAAEHIYDDMYRVIIEDKCLEYKVDWTTEMVSVE